MLTEGPPESDAGAWMRMNPVLGRGRGKGGAVTDRDVTAYRFTLLESDVLPPVLAYSIFARLPFPVFAIIDSAGRGPHAWIRLDCADAEGYGGAVEHMFGLLKKVGIDSSNTNASRLSRLPGATRKIGAVSKGEQRLIYLNPAPELQTPIFQEKKTNE